MNQNEIDQLYRDSFQEFEGQVPDQAWNELSAKLPRPRRRRRWIFLFFALSASLGILIAAILLDFTPSDLKLDEAPSAIKEVITDSTAISFQESEAAMQKTASLITQVKERKRISNTESSEKSFSRIGSELRQTLIDSLTLDKKSDIDFFNHRSKVWNLDTIAFLHPQLRSEIEVSIYPDLVPMSPKDHLIRNRISFFVEANPFFTYQNLHPNVADELLISFPSLNHEISSERLGLQLGAGLYYSLNRKWSLKGGITFTHLDYEMQYDETVLQEYKVLSGDNLSTGITVAPSFTTLKNKKANLKIFDLGVSMAIAYRLNKIRLEAGLNLHYPIQNRKLMLDRQEEFIADSRLATMLQLNATFSLVKFGKGELFIGPQVSYSTASWAFGQAPFAIRNYQGGIKIQYLIF